MVDLENSRILVTGGCGFIGSHLVDALVERGARVRVLDNLATGHRDNIAHHGERVELLVGDLRDPELCAAACSSVNAVFHQGALGSVPRSIADPCTSFAVNVQGTIEIFEAARQAGVERVVYASSSSVYGNTPQLPKTEGEESQALSPYALSKQTDEAIAELFYRCFGQELIGLRYFNVFGARQRPEGPYAAVIPRFFQAIITGESPTIYGDGEQSRDFTAVQDAVAANLCALSAPIEACGQAFNVAGGQRISINQLAREIASVLGCQVEPLYLAERTGDVKHSLADLERSRSMLGYEPSLPLADGLARCREYYERLAKDGAVCA